MRTTFTFFFVKVESVEGENTLTKSYSAAAS
jgi:hypothetical protein